MTDEPSRLPRSKRKAAKSQPEDPKGTFENVEFMDSSLADPLNVLRLKLKHLSQLPESVYVRRVVIICDVVSEETGRGIDLTWNESDDEPHFTVQDSLISLLTRVQQILAGSSED